MSNPPIPRLNQLAQSKGLAAVYCFDIGRDLRAENILRGSIESPECSRWQRGYIAFCCLRLFVLL
jgi:hypothetical protein